MAMVEGDKRADSSTYIETARTRGQGHNDPPRLTSDWADRVDGQADTTRRCSSQLKQIGLQLRSVLVGKSRRPASTGRYHESDLCTETMLFSRVSNACFISC